MAVVTPSPGRTLVIPADLGTIYETSLSFPVKPQSARLDFSLDISAVLAADAASCIQAHVTLHGPEEQLVPIFVDTQPSPGSMLTVVIGGGDLYVAYAVRYTFVTAASGIAPKTYVVDVWLIVANMANFSGQYGGYMTSTGYPTGVGPRGEPGGGVTEAAADSGLVITGTVIGLNGLLLPSDPAGLEPGAPWNNNGVLSFVPAA